MMGTPGGGRAHLHQLLAQEGGELVLTLMALEDREAAQHTSPVSCLAPRAHERLWGGRLTLRRSFKACRLELMIPLATSATMVVCEAHLVEEGKSRLRTKPLRTTRWTVHAQVAGKALCQDDPLTA
jgi:hypothetical protein